MIRPYAAVSGAALSAVPLPLAAAAWVYGPEVLERPSWQALVAGLACLALGFGGLSITRSPRIGRRLVGIGAVSLLGFSAPALLESPAMGLALALLVAAALLSLSGKRAPSDGTAFVRQPLLATRARAASLLSAVWLLAAFTFAPRIAPVELWTLVFSLLISAVLSAHWLDREGVHHLWRSVLLLTASLITVAAIAWAWGDWWTCLAVGSIVPTTAAAIMPVRDSGTMERQEWWEPILGHPERLLGVTFFGLCVAGTILLALPASSASGRSIGFVDAAFTAVSAVCVTGLTVVDTAAAFAPIGQAVIMLLFQLGGLGIMTFSTAAMGLLGRRMSLRHEGAVADLLSPQDRGHLFRATQRLIVFTFTAEGIGALLLTIGFMIQGDDLPQALWRGIFTSISAFCNAGFALQPDSLIPYRGDPFILHTVGLLIIAGSSSPIAILAIPALIRRGSPVSAQVKLVLSSSAALLVIGFLGILLIEWRHGLIELPFVDRVHNAWFQSVTLRTAGFNSVDLTALQPATIALMILWMFIGGSPGGTAGGIKTTTIAVLLLAVGAAMRGTSVVEAFGRRIAPKTVYRAAAILTLGAAGVFLALLALLLTQAMTTQEAFFEVVSALGTVGLSIGGTAALDGVGKAIIMICMFVGRIGTLTLFMFLSHRALFPTVWERPEEEIAVG